MTAPYSATSCAAMNGVLRHIDIDGHRIAVIGHNETASGRPLVLLHGALLSANIWPHALPAALQHRRCYAISLPAHYPGVAPADFCTQPLPPTLLGNGLLRVIRAVIGEQSFTLLGHSSGGYAALAIAAATPTQVHAVCAIAGFAAGRCYGIVGRLQTTARLPVVGNRLCALELGLLSKSRLAARAVSALTAGQPRAYWHWPGLAAMIATATADLQRADWRALAHFLAAMRDQDIRPELPAVRAPVLLLHGSADPIVPPAQARVIAGLVPQAHLCWLPGIGHMPFAESAGAFANNLEAWLQRVDG